MAAAEASGPSGSWPASLLASVFFPQNPSLTVRIISGVFAALGIAFIFPVVSLIVFDFGLWLWRLYAVNRNAYMRQLQQEQQRQRWMREERRKQRQPPQRAPSKAAAAAASQ